MDFQNLRFPPEAYWTDAQLPEESCPETELDTPPVSVHNQGEGWEERKGLKRSLVFSQESLDAIATPEKTLPEKPEEISSPAYEDLEKPEEIPPPAYEDLEKPEEIPPPAYEDLEKPEEIPPPAPEDILEPVPEQQAKKARTEEQAERHRRTSRAWHEKWVKRGVPRVANPDDAESEPAGFTVNLQGSLSEARNEFVAKWIAASTLPPSMESRSKALEAWMASSFRAEMMASREGVQK